MTESRWDLERLERASNFVDWLFDQYASSVRGDVLEVGSGIGTYTERLLREGAASVLCLEPDPACAEALRERFASDPRVTVEAVELSAPSLGGRSFDLEVCQNVLEHVEDDEAAIAALAAALRPGGRLALVVPAHPRLFGGLDRAYGHHRRYTRDGLGALLERAGLVPLELRSFNLLGVPGWFFSSLLRSTRIDPRALAVYDALVPHWRRLESRLRPPAGLSLVAIAERP